MRKIYGLQVVVLILCGTLLSLECAYARTEHYLTKSEAVVIRDSLVGEWKTMMSVGLESDFEECIIRHNGLEMPYSYTVYGSEPVGGHSLWISLHGGGNAPKELNDSQWENQKRLYRPEEGIYLCPRAPWNDWDMWFKEPIDSMFVQLINTMVVLNGVNPDRIYLLGYSAGGDGLWRLAPRMADRLAAASMMAGHPGDVSLLNLRNLPFLMWVGENDSAYNRNVEVVRRGRELDSLQTVDPDGYVHTCHVISGKGHWMDLEDAAALPWMAEYTRNPFPHRIVWQQEEVLKPTFYWLAVPDEELSRGKQVVLDVHRNIIDVDRCDYSSLTFYLNDEIVNLDRPVRVRCHGKTVWKGKLNRTVDIMRRTLAERNDPGLMAACMLTVRF